MESQRLHCVFKEGRVVRDLHDQAVRPPVQTEQRTVLYQGWWEYLPGVAVSHADTITWHSHVTSSLRWMIEVYHCTPSQQVTEVKSGTEKWNNFREWKWCSWAPSRVHCVKGSVSLTPSLATAAGLGDQQATAQQNTTYIQDSRRTSASLEASQWYSPIPLQPGQLQVGLTQLNIGIECHLRCLRISCLSSICLSRRTVSWTYCVISVSLAQMSCLLQDSWNGTRPLC